MTRSAKGASIDLAGVALEKLWQLNPTVSGSGRFLPQANDLQKIFDAIRTTKLDIVDQQDLVHLFRFDKRQASYYLEAALELGLVEIFGRDSYKLTETGQELRRATEPAALTLFMVRVLSLPVVLRVVSELRQSPQHSLSRQALRNLVQLTGETRYSGSTLERRLECLVAWLRWLENNSEFALVPTRED